MFLDLSPCRHHCPSPVTGESPSASVLSGVTSPSVVALTSLFTLLSQQRSHGFLILHLPIHLCFLHLLYRGCQSILCLYKEPRLSAAFTTAVYSFLKSYFVIMTVQTSHFSVSDFFFFPDYSLSLLFLCLFHETLSLAICLFGSVLLHVGFICNRQALTAELCCQHQVLLFIRVLSLIPRVLTLRRFTLAVLPPDVLVLKVTLSTEHGQTSSPLCTLCI